MNEGHSLALTQAQLVSSLLGYCGLGVAIACFIPLILGNAARRRSGTGGLFLAIWLVADVVNLAGIIRLGAPLTQIFLAAWYFIADIIMGVELLLWGHPGGLAPSPTPAKTLLKKREQEAKSKVILHFDEQFADWSLWDNAKIVTSCIFVGMAWWGVYLVVMIYRTEGGFEIEIPMSHTLEAFLLGGLGTALFTIARTPEMYEGWDRNRKREPPTQELTDGVFVFLIIENVFNLSSIMVLAFDPSLAEDGLRETYLLGELPWILGAVVPIIFDAILVGLIIHWQRTWKLRKDSAKQDHEKAHDDLLNDIERVSAALLHLRERKEELELKNTALEHLAAVQSKNKKRKDNKKWTDPLREKVGRQKKDKKSSLNEDYHQNWEKMQPNYRDSRSRKKHDELADQYGPLNLRTDSAYGSDAEKFSSDSGGENAEPLALLSTHQTSSIRSHTSANSGHRRNV